MEHHITIVESAEGVTVWHEGLPGCCPQGANRDEAMTNIRTRLEERLQSPGLRPAPSAFADA